MAANWVGGISSNFSVSLNGSHIISNTSTNGDTGGIHSFGPVTLTNSTVSGNASGNNVGGIQAVGLLTMTDSTVDGNTATIDHGGIWAGAGAQITNSTISNNTAVVNVGGIYASGVATLTNSTISNNSAGSNGGGIWAFGTATLTNSSIYDNSAGTNGRSVYVEGGSVTTSNSIIASSAPGAANCFIAPGGVINSAGHNISDDGSCNLAGVGDASASATITASLAPLAANGGTTMTHALLTGSPAIDSYPQPCARPTDQRNRARGGDGDNDAISGCDIGAYEASAYGCTDPTATNYDPLAVLDSGGCTYTTPPPPPADRSITITVDVTDGQGGKATKTLKLTPQ